jgi:hypothetical protein
MTFGSEFRCQTQPLLSCSVSLYNRIIATYKLSCPSPSRKILVTLPKKRENLRKTVAVVVSLPSTCELVITNSTATVL